MSDRLYKRGDVWWCSFYAGTPPRRVRRTTHCTDKSAARQRLREYEQNPDAADRPAGQAPSTVGDALCKLIEHGGQDVAAGTQRMRTTKAGHLLRLLGSCDINRISIDDVQRYIETRTGKEENAARMTVRKELSTLKVALDYAVQRGARRPDANSPIPKFRVRYVPRTRYLTVEEFRKLLPCLVMQRRLDGTLPESDKALLRRRQLWLFLACFTGARDSELASVRWDDVAPDWSGLSLRGTKTAGSRRWIPMHPMLAAELKQAGRKGGPIVGLWSNVRRGLSQACVRAGIEPITPNDCRRTFASWMKQAGAESKAVATLLGHTSTQMVDRVYGHLDNRAIVVAIDKLPQFEWHTGVTPGSVTTAKGSKTRLKAVNA